MANIAAGPLRQEAGTWSYSNELDMGVSELSRTT